MRPTAQSGVVALRTLVNRRSRNAKVVGLHSIVIVWMNRCRCAVFVGGVLLTSQLEELCHARRYHHPVARLHI